MRFLHWSWLPVLDAFRSTEELSAPDYDPRRKARWISEGKVSF